jgi:hypothetical protein
MIDVDALIARVESAREGGKDGGPSPIPVLESIRTDAMNALLLASQESRAMGDRRDFSGVDRVERRVWLARWVHNEVACLITGRRFLDSLTPQPQT